MAEQRLDQFVGESRYLTVDFRSGLQAAEVVDSAVFTVDIRKPSEGDADYVDPTDPNYVAPCSVRDESIDANGQQVTCYVDTPAACEVEIVCTATCTWQTLKESAVVYARDITED